MTFSPGCRSTARRLPPHALALDLGGEAGRGGVDVAKRVPSPGHQRVGTAPQLGGERRDTGDEPPAVETAFDRRAGVSGAENPADPHLLLPGLDLCLARDRCVRRGGVDAEGTSGGARVLVRRRVDRLHGDAVGPVTKSSSGERRATGSEAGAIDAALESRSWLT